MKVYKEIALSSTQNYGNLVDMVRDNINDFQNQGLQVEVQYLSCATDCYIIYSALILAYTEKYYANN